MLAEPILSVKSLYGERGDQILFNDVNFELAEGDALHVQGVNGSGKSSLLKLLTLQSRFDEGEVVYKGHCIKTHSEQYKRAICFIGHQQGIKNKLTLKANIQFFCQFFPIKKHIDIDEVLAQLNLLAFADFPTYQLSQGQKQRLALSRFLFSSASIWVMDEPYTALDSDGRQLLTQIIEGFLADSGIVILTHHAELSFKAKVCALGRPYKYG